MINYSNTSMFRCKCIHCFQPVAGWRAYSSIDFGISDIIQELKYNDIYLYITQNDMAQYMLTYRKHQSFAINMFAYIGSIIKETKFNRRKNICNRDISNFKGSNESPGMARCKCGRTYWITYDLSKELFPEYNRKSKYKMSFK